VRSNYYSGSKMAEGGVWGRSTARSYHVFQPALLLVRFNGSPEIRRLVLEAADGLLAHRRQAGNGRTTTTPNIEFTTDRELPGFGEAPWACSGPRIAGRATRNLQPLPTAGGRHRRHQQ
jgi:hypothetical protein